ncbi:MAG: carotenoid oxygenase family protein [Myxococcota bacterium]|nr:carotenoid oxygenase family protein [Myxococcota bacterium]
MSETSPWLRGAFEPVAHEIDREDLPVEGALPPELCGSLLRIGPNPVRDPGPRYQWFTGAGMVHEIRLEGGRATRYRNRWVRTPAAARELGETPPSPDWPTVDPANTHVFRIGDGVFALTEGCQPFRLDAALGTVGRDDLGGAIVHGFTAHPHRCPVTGEVHAAGYDLNDAPRLTHYVLDAHGKLVTRFPVELAGPVSVHDFAMTEKHFLYYDLPLLYDASLDAEGWPIPYRWHPEHPSRVGVLRRGAPPETIRWLDVTPGWVFHTLNAYDVPGPDGQVDEIVCDVVRFEKVFEQDITGPGDPYPPQLHRWRIDLRGGHVSETLVDERMQEFPRIDERHWSRPHRLGFTTELFSPEGGSGVLAHDLEGRSTAFRFEAGTRASEMVFAPASEDAAEGEGWLLGTIWSADSGASDLVVFDATRVDAGPIARARLPQRVPVGFHGDWFPGELPR